MQGHDGHVLGRQGPLFDDGDVGVHAEVFYTDACTGRVDLSVRSLGRARIRSGQLRCVNPDRAGLSLQPHPVTEKPDKGLTHAIRFALVELCEKAPEVHLDLHLAEDGFVRAHKLFFRLPIVLPLFLRPFPLAAQQWSALWARGELYAVAKSVQLPADVPDPGQLLRVLTLGGSLTVASTAVQDHHELRIAAHLPAHGCLSAAPVVLLEVQARFTSGEATLLELRAEDGVLARQLMEWFLWLLAPRRLPLLPDGT